MEIKQIPILATNPQMNPQKTENDVDYLGYLQLVFDACGKDPKTGRSNKKSRLNFHKAKRKLREAIGKEPDHTFDKKLALQILKDFYC